MGRIPAVSGIPVADCPNAKHCKKECYAMKAWRQYKNVRSAWGGNSKLLRNDMKSYFDQLGAYLDKKKPWFFRFHVAGDIISKRHFRAICDISRKHPKTRFLIFTKAFRYIDKDIPENLSLVLSVWNTMKFSDIPSRLYDMPKAFAGDCGTWPGYDKAIRCPGNCETCGACWDLSNNNLNVRFEKH